MWLHRNVLNMTRAPEMQWNTFALLNRSGFFFFLNVGDFCEIFAYKKNISPVENLNSLLSVQRALPAWPGNTMLAGSGTACLKPEGLGTLIPGEQRWGPCPAHQTQRLWRGKCGWMLWSRAVCGLPAGTPRKAGTGVLVWKDKGLLYCCKCG